MTNCLLICSIFQSTLPIRGSDGKTKLAIMSKGISIRAPLAGSDKVLLGSCVTVTHFNPRPPRGGRRTVADEIAAAEEFQPTPPAGRLQGEIRAVIQSAISIRAPREGGDNVIREYLLYLVDT